jgi:hypothetical protein
MGEGSEEARRESGALIDEEPLTAHVFSPPIMIDSTHANHR